MSEQQPPLVEGRVIVVLDVNVLLDAARATGEPFTWPALEALSGTPGCPMGAEAILALKRGVLVDGRAVEVWTSHHIDRLVALKASQPTDAEDERDRGLGWSVVSAQGLIDVLITDLLTATRGGSAGEISISYGTPPLSHEDGCVYATVRDAGHPDTHYEERCCLTRDGHFLRSTLPGLIDVHHPREWVLAQRAEARAIGFRRMLGGA